MNCIKHFDTSRRITTTPAITVRPLSENIASPELRRFTHFPGCGLWLVDAMTKYYLGTRRLELQCIKVGGSCRRGSSLQGSVGVCDCASVCMMELPAGR